MLIFTSQQYINIRFVYLCNLGVGTVGLMKLLYTSMKISNNNQKKRERTFWLVCELFNILDIIDAILSACVRLFLQISHFLVVFISSKCMYFYAYSFLLMVIALTCHLNVIKTKNGREKCTHMPYQYTKKDGKKKIKNKASDQTNENSLRTKSNKTADNRNNDEQKIPIEFSAWLCRLRLRSCHKAPAHTCVRSFVRSFVPYQCSHLFSHLKCLSQKLNGLLFSTIFFLCRVYA